MNGQHTAPALQQLLAKYIQGFVLCTACGLPETSECVLDTHVLLLLVLLDDVRCFVLFMCSDAYLINRPPHPPPPNTDYKIKGGVIFQKCDACGEKSMVDMQHKLTTFILNRYAGRVDGAPIPLGCVCAWEGVKARQDTNADDGFHPFIRHSHKKEKAAGGGKKDKKKDKGDKVRCVVFRGLSWWLVCRAYIEPVARVPCCFTDLSNHFAPNDGRRRRGARRTAGRRRRRRRRRRTRTRTRR